MPDQEEIDRINMTKNRREVDLINMTKNQREVDEWKATAAQPHHPFWGHTQMQNRMMRMQSRQRATFPNLWHDPPTYLYPGQPHPTAAPPHVLWPSIFDAHKNKNEKAGGRRGVGTVKRKRKPHHRSSRKQRRTNRSHTRKRGHRARTKKAHKKRPARSRRK